MAVFSLLDGVMLKNLPVPDPQQLRILTWPRDNAVPMANHSGYTIEHPVTGQKVSGSPPAAPRAFSRPRRCYE